MGLKITSKSCDELEHLTPIQISLDKSRVDYIVTRKLKSVSGRRRLGYIWLVLHPLFLSMVYLFVFTVIRSNPNMGNLLVGITMFNIFSSSIKSGVNSVRDFSGGIKGERVRTRVISRSMIKYRMIDVGLQASGVSLVLFFYLGVSIPGLVGFVSICMALGVISELFALNVSMIARRIPDLTNIVDYTVMLMFFGSPVLYSLSSTSGLHRRINEFNPFTYFVESGRQLTLAESSIGEILVSQSIPIFVFVFLLAARGYFTLDRLRWEVSSWS